MNTGDSRESHLCDGSSSEYEVRVDREELAATVVKFWSDLQGAAEGSMKLISGFLIGRRLHGITKKSFALPAERDAAGCWVAKEASLGRDVYMKPTVAAVGGGKAAVYSVGAEVDMSRLAILPRPSVSLEVSRERVQCYWRLEHPMPHAEAEKLVRRLMWSLDRPMVLPGMPDNRGFGIGRFDCPECLPLTYSYDDLAQGFPQLRTSGPSWEPGILRPSEAFMQRARMATAIFGGGALRVALASTTAAAAAIGGFLIPNPLTDEAPGPESVAAADLSSPDLPGQGQSPLAAQASLEALVQTAAPAQTASRAEPQSVIQKSRLEATTDEGRAQVEQIQETDEVGEALTSGGEITRATFDRSTGTLLGGSS